MLNGTKPLLSAGDLLSFAEYICNALFVVPVVAFRFLAHDPVKILILVLAWWYGQFTWRENHHIQWITLKDSFFFNCTKLFALILIQCQSCWNVPDITKQLQPLINGFFLSCEYDWLTSTADATFLLIFIFIAVINAQLIFLVIAVCCIFCIIHDLVVAVCWIFDQLIVTAHCIFYDLIIAEWCIFYDIIITDIWWSFEVLHLEPLYIWLLNLPNTNYK